MDLELVRLDPLRKTYYLTNYYSELVIADRSIVSQKELLASLKQMRKLGLSAELCIMNFEKERLHSFPDLAKRIVHSSLISINYGFDIQSYEDILTQDERPIMRYIEVKTFPINNPLFYWSKNEVDTSKLLGKSYWLYLLPHDSHGGFLLPQIEMICNPSMSLFNEQKWSCLVDSYTFTRK